jgi:hypothetical protein
MWRKAAIRTMLIDDLCSLRPRGEPSPPEEPHQPDLRLQKAQRKSALIVAVDWLALLILFALHSDPDPWLAFGPQVETVFTIGVLAVAVHSGFRLGQLEKLRATARVLDDLDSRSPDN